ncbi:cell wall-binding repeat-containing protein [Herbiconiux daphne]|uniref:Cell wall-binding repeat-containing protein n=1 Tax=Herbiconiux daphne TaxID=2970914 RepID=A0ABT2GZM8_9MICO|nr:cell wall-binding repeat-containing protein [Herbiconiux daphne]MCS5733416.1 cell wall-binding repeat-containing protein [Herbiconiux daphne]
MNHDITDSEEGMGYETSLTGGTLPDGLALQSRPSVSKVIVGTPTKVGPFTMTFHVVKDGSTGTKSCTSDVVPSDSIFDRIGGTDRYDVAANIALKMLVDSTTTKGGIVYVANGENFADALSASAVAAQHGAPLLLTTAGQLPPQTTQMMSILAPKQIVIVGGENSVSATVATDLQRRNTASGVTRIGGPDRFAVSRNLISDPTFGAAASTSLYVASGLKFPDALSASPAAAKIKTPVLLVNGQAASLTTDEKALLTARGVTTPTVFGGEDTLSAGVAADLKTVTGSVSRIEGDDRFIVSANITAANYTAPIDTIYFATGATYPDALAGGVLAGIGKAPILLVQKTCVAPEVAAQVRALAPKHIVLLGGPNSLSATLENLPLCN